MVSKPIRDERQRQLRQSWKEYTQVKKNIYIDRKKHAFTDDEAFVCQCPNPSKITKEEKEKLSIPYDKMDEDEYFGCGANCLNKTVSWECVESTCPSGIACRNRRFQLHQYAEVYPKRTENRGWGLFAGEFLPKGSFVMQYIGEIYSIDSEYGIKKLHEYKDKNSINYFDIENIDFKDNHNHNFVKYLQNIYSKLLIYISLSPNFHYNESLADEFDIFFEDFIHINKTIKKYYKNNNIEIDTVEAFRFFKEDDQLFSKLVEQYNSFLAVLLFHLGDPEEDLRDEKSFMVLISCVKVFNFFYKINEKYKIISYKEFYNDSMSKHLNLKEECKKYFIKINAKNEDERKIFSLIKYHWLFDPSAKSDILHVFNYHKQRTEMMSSFNDLLNPMNLININSMFLAIEVRRNNLIEDALNSLSNPMINLKKPLKVKFVGEQGIDEGGVKKEFFMLLVRLIFDPDYGMFTYNEKNRFFWFNLQSFEPGIKFELIGMILGLAFFNNVILDIKFPLVIYKKLLNLPTGLDDLKEIDPELYNNLRYLLTTQEKNLKDLSLSGPNLEMVIISEPKIK